MRKKFFLFIIAAFMATSSAWATCPQYFHDTIPAQRYITNFEVVWENKEGDKYELPYLRFEDTFRPDLRLERKYRISIEARHANDLNTGCKFRYITQADEPSATLHWDQYEYWSTYNDIQLSLGDHIEERPLSFGGNVINQDLDIFFHFAVANGAREVIFFVNPQYKDVNEVTGDTKYESFYGDEGDRHRLYNINYFTYTLPDIVINKLSAPKEVKSGKKLKIESAIQAFGSVTYKLQERSNGNWRTIKSGSISTAEARAEKTIQYEEDFGNGHAPVCEYRMIVTDVESNKTDTSEIQQVKFLYKQAFNNNEFYYCAGDTFYTYVEPDCWEYKVTSDLPVSKKIVGKLYEWIMPACDLTILYQQSTYTVKFLNADYTLLKTVEVECGADATSEAPADPTYSTYTFIGWSQDLTNVHRNMSVLAKYDIGNTYWFDAYMSNHDNVVYPAEGFTQNLTRAMVGDKLTFTAEVFAATNATIAYETAFWDNNAQDYLWQKNGHIKVADYTTPNKWWYFDQAINVCYTPNNSYINPFQRKMAVRFIMFIAGQTIYSEPWEIDIYYPLFINAPEMDALFVENTAGDFNIGEQNIFIPAGYNDTVRLYSINNADGGCLSFGRVLYPDRRLESGIDEEGNAFIIGPGELETVSTSVSEKLVVFDGVFGNGYPKQLDFTAEGFGKMNGYYGEVVPCGGSVTMPEDPTQENAIFIGWQAWNNDYADDAYLHVPAVDDNIIGFTAQWEYLPEVPTYTVIFFDKDGNILSTQEVEEGENAVPPVAPEVPGFHFVGWDKPYTTITADVDITALYGEDTKTWTVTYKNWDGSDLGSEQVNDGEAAQGVNATREGYTFVKWIDYTTGDDVDMDHITADITVQAVFTETLYTVSYRVEGEVTYTIQVVHGFAASSIYYPHGTPTKASTEAKVYTFTGWTPEVATITEDVTFDAVFEESARTYTVVFQNWDHTLLSEQQVEYGKSAVAPEDPTREGYTFKGWDREFDNILADMTVTALFEQTKNQGGATGIEDIDASTTFDGAQKILHEGMLYIIRLDGQIINALGVRVK